MDLSLFMKGSVIQLRNDIKYAPSTRYINPATGKPLEWTIRQITSQEEIYIRESCTKMVADGTRGALQPVLDNETFMTRIVLACIVEPEMRSVELQESWGVHNEIDLLNTMLMPGEIMNLKAEIQELLGYNRPAKETIKEIKN